MKQIILCIFLGFLLASCGNTPNTASDTTLPPAGSGSKIGVTPVNLSYVTNVPLVNGAAQRLSILATNNLDKPLSLSSFTVSAGNQVLDNKSSGFDASQCATLVANGVCNISLSGQGFSGNSAKQYVIKTVFNDTDGNTYTAIQEVNYQSNAQPVNGVYVSRNSINVSIPGETKASVVIPFTLAQDFNSVSVTSSVPLNSINTVCSGGYKKGNSCLATLQVTGNNGTYQSAVKIIGVLNNKQQVTNTLPMSVSSNQTANIITSANVFIQQGSTGVGSTNVTLYNSGLASANIISVVSQDSNILVNNQCGSTLDTGQSCLLTLSSSASNNISTSVVISYATVGQNDNTSTIFSVNYYTNAAVTTPQIDATPDSLNAFMNVPINPTTAYGPLIITYSNSGKIPVTNLQIPNGLTQLDSAFTIDNTTATACQNGATLGSGASCTVSFYYNPQSVVTAWARPFAILGQYIPSGESSTTLTLTSQSTTISVSTVSQVANISFTKSQPSAIRADGESSTTFSITATNVGGISATNVNFTYLAVDGVSKTSSTCDSLNSLAADESCTVNYQFGPIKTQVDTSAVIESVSYLPAPSGPYSNTVSTDASVQLNASTAALIKVQSVLPNGSVSGCNINENPAWGCYSGDGTNTNPLYFSNIGQPQSQMTITYQNIGTESAESFNVALGNLPLGVMVSSNSSCGNGSSNGSLTTELSPNGVCTIILDAVANYGIGNDPLKDQIVLGSNLTLNVPMPQVSYVDSSTGVNQTNPVWESSPSGIYMVAQNLTQMSVTNVTLTLDSTTASYITTITLQNGGSYPITWVGNWNAASMNISSDVNTDCTNGITSGSSCTVSLTSPAGMLVPNYTYMLGYSYEITGYGTSYLPGWISIQLPSQPSN